jgi:hypothetical protein
MWQQVLDITSNKKDKHISSETQQRREKQPPPSPPGTWPASRPRTYAQHESMHESWFFSKHHVSMPPG